MIIEINDEQLKWLQEGLRRYLIKLDFYSDDWEQHNYLKLLNTELELLDNKKNLDQEEYAKQKDKVYNFYLNFANLRKGGKLQTREDKND